MLLFFELNTLERSGPFEISRTGVLLLFSTICCILGRVVVGRERWDFGYDRVDMPV